MIKRVVGIQFNPWDQVYHFDGGGTDASIGDKVLVKTETGLDVGKIVSFSEIDDATLDADLKPIVRRANKDDLKKMDLLENKKETFLKKARSYVEKNKLDMKLVDCYFSFDGGKIVFVFTADGRVDFRDLVKDLAREFQKSIRMQQIGIRDEARRLGGFGQCGRELCCRKFLHNLNSVTTDSARIQQVSSRGSDRISGACGRLMCCLSYEKEFYQEALKKFPKVGSTVKSGQDTGKVISCNVLKDTVTVDIDKNYVEIPLKNIK